jgi:broad specificity phosphatase PhoE
MKLIFLRHFKPNVQKDKPVAEWDLNEEGEKEMHDLLEKGIFKDVKKIFTSSENKAQITAKAVNQKYGTPISVCPNITEVDRSKAGYVEGDYVEFVRLYLTESNDFNFAWENISDVRERIKKFIESIKNENGDLLIISHGMCLSIMLSKYFEKDIINFWKNLKFGQVLEVDYEKLRKCWFN